MHSTMNKKGQTTIPAQVREALKIKPGDKLEYVLGSNYVTFRAHPRARAPRGALASNKGKALSFSQIRKAAIKGGGALN